MRSAPNTTKKIDSKFADMKNTGGRDGDRLPRRSFWQRFVDKTPWAPSRHCRHRHGFSAERHQQELGFGFRRPAAGSLGGGLLREMKRRRR